MLALIRAQTKVTPGAELDFWTGKWKVFSEGKLDGTDVVETIVSRFGIIENWRDDTGATGTSLFYYMPARKQWKQVWVTEAGVYKEKVSEPWPKGIRFTGRIFLPDGREIQDRTTLTRIPGGNVRQVIEYSKDGHRWTKSYDAVYKR